MLDGDYRSVSYQCISSCYITVVIRMRNSSNRVSIVSNNAECSTIKIRLSDTMQVIRKVLRQRYVIDSQ